MTFVWLPLVPPSGPSPSKPSAGWRLQLAGCNASDAMQRFSLAGGTLIHSPSSLCVTGGPSLTQLALAECVAGEAEQHWVASASESGGTISNGESGAGCLDLNNANDVLAAGNEIIAYQCGSAWNERWEIGGDILEALDQEGRPSSFCAAVAPAAQGWTLPWLPAWSLKDY